MCAIWWPRTPVVHCLEKDVRTQEAFVARNNTEQSLLCKTWHGKPILVIWHIVSTINVLVGSQEILTTLIELKTKQKNLEPGEKCKLSRQCEQLPSRWPGCFDLAVFSKQSQSRKIVMIRYKDIKAALLCSVKFCKECKLYNLHCSRRFRAKPLNSQTTAQARRDSIFDRCHRFAR